MCQPQSWYWILLCWKDIFLQSQNQISLGSFHCPEECYWVSSLYGQHINVIVHEYREVLELSLQLCGHELAN